MADNIGFIHANKLAKYLKQYIGKDGTVYIGQKDGRLAKKRVTESTVENIVNNSTVTNITVSPPLNSTGGPTPNISIPQASATQDGYLSAADYVAFSSGGGGVTKGFVIAMAVAL